MGNEMGNNNTSGFQEEIDTTAEAIDKSLQQVGHADNVKGENQVIPPPQSKDYLEKVTDPASDDPKVGDTHVDDHKSGEREQEENEAEPTSPNNRHATDSTHKSLQEPLQQDDLKGENYMISPAESKNDQLKVEISASDDDRKSAEDAHEERDPKETEVDSPSMSKLAADMQESVHDDDMKVTNHETPSAESEDYDEKVTSSTSDDPSPTKAGDAHVDNLMSPEREKDESEVHPPSITSSAADSPKTSLDVANANDNMKTKNNHENVLSLSTDDPKEVGDAGVDNQNKAEKEEEAKVESPMNVNGNSSDDPKKCLQVCVDENNLNGENGAVWKGGNINCVFEFDDPKEAVVGDVAAAEDDKSGGGGGEQKVDAPGPENIVKGENEESESIEIVTSEEETAEPQKAAIKSNQHASLSAPRGSEDYKESNCLEARELEKQTSIYKGEEEAISQKCGDVHCDEQKTAIPNCQQEVKAECELEREKSSSSRDCFTKTIALELTDFHEEAQDKCMLLLVSPIESTKFSHVNENENDLAAVNKAPTAAKQGNESWSSRFSSGSSGPQSVGRSSTDSLHPQMTKSPSFNLHLQIEATKQALHFANPNGTQETSHSHNLATPFHKEEEEANIVNVIAPKGLQNYVTSTNKENIGSSSSSAKAKEKEKEKEKRKARPFLFGTCMCCATVIN